jgi:hypothetical protein
MKWWKMSDSPYQYVQYVQYVQYLLTVTNTNTINTMIQLSQLKHSYRQKSNSCKPETTFSPGGHNGSTTEHQHLTHRRAGTLSSAA